MKKLEFSIDAGLMLLASEGDDFFWRELRGLVHIHGGLPPVVNGFYRVTIEAVSAGSSDQDDLYRRFDGPIGGGDA